VKRALLALVVLISVATGAAGVTAAANSTATNTTATPTETATSTPTATPERPANPMPDPTTAGSESDRDRPNRTLIRVGPHLSVVDYRYDGDLMHVTLHADIPTRAAISDVLGPVSESGARAVPVKTVMVDGTMEVSMDVEEYRGSAAISVGTSDGAVYVSTGIDPVNPFAGGSATLGWFGGAGLSILMFTAAAIYKMRSEGGAPEVAE
jgi:hypothetical protein